MLFHLIVVYDALGHGLIQHLLVPLLQPFGFGDFLVHGVTVEDVIVALTGRTSPDMTRSKSGDTRKHQTLLKYRMAPVLGRISSHIHGLIRHRIKMKLCCRSKVGAGFLPLSFHILQVPQQDLVVDSRPEVSRFEEVHTVQIGDVNSSLIGRWAVRAILLDMHPKKTHICSVNVFKGKQSFHPVWEGLRHLSAVHKPAGGPGGKSEEERVKGRETEQRKDRGKWEEMEERRLKMLQTVLRKLQHTLLD